MTRALALVLLCGCQRLPSPSGAFAAAPECDPEAFRATAARYAMRPALEPCGSNPVGWFAWSPDGRHLLFGLSEGAYVVDVGSDGKDTVRVPVDPTGPGTWVDPERVVVPVSGGLATWDLDAGQVSPLTLPGMSDPADLRAGPDGVLVLTAVRDGRRRIVGVDLHDGAVSDPFPWAHDLPVDAFDWQPAVPALTVASGGTVTLYDAHGTARGAWTGALAGTLHPGGRWLALQDAVAPDRPPTISIVDRVTGDREVLDGPRGTAFRWYEATDYYGSLLLWGFDDAPTRPNVVLGDLAGELSRAERAGSR